MRKLKLVSAALCSVLPFNFLRIFAYRYLLGYKIKGAKIGFATIIAVDKAEISACKIGAGNLFTGPMQLTIEEGASIGYGNIFSCGYWAIRPEHAEKNYARKLFIAKDTLITSRHYLDTTGAFTLGTGSWIAGFASQFWTHGVGVEDRDITIGENCYIGSAARFSPGSSIGDRTLVAMGSVVTKKFIESDVLLGGMPAKILKQNHHWRDKQG